MESECWNCGDPKGTNRECFECERISNKPMIKQEPHPIPHYNLPSPPAALESGGVKYDQGKLPYHLIAPDFLDAIAEILKFGAEKYAPRNWEKGMDWSKVYRALIGHAFSWWKGEAADKETGKSHLWHCACCVMFLVCYEIRGIGKDDRPAN